jgi:hypothetical protein
LTTIKVKFIGGYDYLCLKVGEVYEAFEPKDDTRFFAVKDMSGDFYVYPKGYFEVIE